MKWAPTTTPSQPPLATTHHTAHRTPHTAHRTPHTAHHTPHATTPPHRHTT